MGREIRLQQLAQAAQSVAECRAFIAQQQRLIVQSERDDQDAVGAGNAKAVEVFHRKMCATEPLIMFMHDEARLAKAARVTFGSRAQNHHGVSAAGSANEYHRET